MHLNHKNCWMRIGAFFLSVILLAVSVFPVQATKTVDELEDKTSELESELSGLNKDLSGLEKELNNLIVQMNKTSKSLTETKKELAIAKGQEEAQYESMKLRIKYMYENGNLSYLDAFFTSSSMGEFLSKVEYISAISEYDRELLKELEVLSEEIANKEAKLEEEQAYLVSLQEELEKKEEALKEKIADTSTDLSTYTAKLKKARKDAEEATKKPVKPITPDRDQSSSSGNSRPSVSTGSSVSASASDIELLAALLECEAGSRNYDAVLAVASVVVNRMKSRYYPDTVRGVIYQSGQFPPAHDGKVDRVLSRGVKPICVQAAKDALAGKNNVGNCLSFRAASSGRDGIVIGDNVFF